MIFFAFVSYLICFDFYNIKINTFRNICVMIVIWQNYAVFPITCVIEMLHMWCNFHFVKIQDN